MHKQFNSLKQKFHGLAKPWKISIYSAGMILALFLLFFAAKSVVEYRQYAIQQRQIHDAEMLAEKSQKSNDFPGMIPRSVKMRVDKSPHYYNNQGFFHNSNTFFSSSAQGSWHFSITIILDAAFSLYKKSF